MTQLRLTLLFQACYILCDWWLYHWSTAQEKRYLSRYFADDANHTSSSRDDTTDPPLFSTHFSSPVADFYVYFGLVMTFLLLTFCRSAIFTTCVTRASRVLHDDMFYHVLRAPMSFFEKTPVNKIWSRFGRDLSNIDESLPSCLFDVIHVRIQMTSVDI